LAIAKKVETMEAPQNRGFNGKMECLPLWPTYIGEKGHEIFYVQYCSSPFLAWANLFFFFYYVKH
jgi:hypothetical protein